MKKQDRLIALTAAISLTVGLVLGAGVIPLIAGRNERDFDNQDLYALYDSAVKDAAFAEPDEIMPLVSLTKEDPLVTWDELGERVLLCTWHNYPDSDGRENHAGMGQCLGVYAERTGKEI